MRPVAELVKRVTPGTTSAMELQLVEDARREGYNAGALEPRTPGMPRLVVVQEDAVHVVLVQGGSLEALHRDAEAFSRLKLLPCRPHLCAAVVPPRDVAVLFDDGPVARAQNELSNLLDFGQPLSELASIVDTVRPVLHAHLGVELDPADEGVFRATDRLVVALRPAEPNEALSEDTPSPIYVISALGLILVQAMLLRTAPARLGVLTDDGWADGQILRDVGGLPMLLWERGIHLNIAGKVDKRWRLGVGEGIDELAQRMLGVLSGSASDDFETELLRDMMARLGKAPPAAELPPTSHTESAAAMTSPIDADETRARLDLWQLASLALLAPLCMTSDGSQQAVVDGMRSLSEPLFAMLLPSEAQVEARLAVLRADPSLPRRSLAALGALCESLDAGPPARKTFLAVVARMLPEVRAAVEEAMDAGPRAALEGAAVQMLADSPQTIEAMRAAWRGLAFGFFAVSSADDGADIEEWIAFGSVGADPVLHAIMACAPLDLREQYEALRGDDDGMREGMAALGTVLSLHPQGDAAREALERSLFYVSAADGRVSEEERLRIGGFMGVFGYIRFRRWARRAGIAVLLLIVAVVVLRGC